MTAVQNWKISLNLCGLLRKPEVCFNYVTTFYSTLISVRGYLDHKTEGQEKNQNDLKKEPLPHTAYLKTKPLNITPNCELKSKWSLWANLDSATIF